MLFSERILGDFSIQNPEKVRVGANFDGTYLSNSKRFFDSVKSSEHPILRTITYEKNKKNSFLNQDPPPVPLSLSITVIRFLHLSPKVNCPRFSNDDKMKAASDAMAKIVHQW